MKQRSNRRAVYAVVTVLLAGAVALLVAAASALSDARSGTPGKAHVTQCEAQSYATETNVSCAATWIYNGRRVSGWVQNAKLHYQGKTLAVRIHGADHVTVASYGLTIELALLGLLAGGVAVWLLVKFRRAPQTT